MNQDRYKIGHMMSRVRVEIRGRNRYWRDAVPIEWEHHFPERKLVGEGEGSYVIDESWLLDLETIAARCFSTVAIAPDDPGRLSWLRRLVARREGE